MTAPTGTLLAVPSDERCIARFADRTMHRFAESGTLTV